MRRIAAALLAVILLAAPSTRGQTQGKSAGKVARAETTMSKTVVRITGQIPS
jgi:hypothetical protein